jgi:hypothetical protein
MIIDPESFRELATHLERVSRNILRTAQHLAAVEAERAGDDEEWGALLDRVMAIVMEMIVVDKLVNALREANRLEGQPDSAALGRD